MKFDCATHGEFDPQRQWGCPDCVAELRRALRTREEKPQETKDCSVYRILADGCEAVRMASTTHHAARIVIEQLNQRILEIRRLEEEALKVREQFANALGWQHHESGHWHSPACVNDQENCGGKLPPIGELVIVATAMNKQLAAANKALTETQKEES